ncbi:MAG: FG-GAP-like repeat-containing protein [Myxococcota bacterium]
MFGWGLGCEGVPGSHAGEPRLVVGLTAEAPAGRWITASYVGEGSAPSIDGAPLEQVVDDPDRFGIWRLPDGLDPGPATIAFDGGPRGVQRLPIAVTAPWFDDVAGDVGLDAEQDVGGWQAGCAESLTALAVGDLDLDGVVDVIVGNLSGPSRLYVGRGTGLPTFRDSGALADVDLVSSLDLADWDDDGDQDLFVGRRGPNRLLENRWIPDGALRFDDVTEDVGLVAADQRTTTGAWGDFDGDGDLDLYEVNHAWCWPDPDPAVDHHNADHLYRNDDGRLVDATDLLPDDAHQVGDRFGFAAVWLDLDRDLDQDLLVVEDFVPSGGPTVWFRNDGGRFVDATDGSGIAPAIDPFGKGLNAMGVAIGDVNRDGLPDLAYSNIGPNVLVESVGPGRWVDRSFERGIQRGRLPWGDTSVTWGTHLLDVDLDGDLDLLYAGGPLRSTAPQPHALFENPGDGGPFVDRTWSAGIASPGRGAASVQLDLDGDGWLDWIVANWGGPPEVWRNTLGDAREAHWLAIDLVGDGDAVVRDALGAVVEVERLDGRIDTCFRTAMPSMSSSGDRGCWFGLGEDPEVAGVLVVWPDGARQTVAVPGVDRRLTVTRAP